MTTHRARRLTNGPTRARCCCWCSAACTTVACARVRRVACVCVCGPPAFVLLAYGSAALAHTSRTHTHAPAHTFTRTLSLPSDPVPAARTGGPAVNYARSRPALSIALLSRAHRRRVQYNTIYTLHIIIICIILPPDIMLIFPGNV